MGDEPLVLDGISKSFAGRSAVRDLSFAVPRGAILGFLGPNGAGKSTSLRIALGVLAPDAGEARLFGGPPRIEALRRVGFLPEERGLYRRMTVQGTIAYFAQLKGLDAKTANDRARALLEAHGLGDSARKTISKLSKGMAQKVQILAAVIHEPEFIILDEPFSGLDPVNQQGLEKLITDVHQRGATIVFSTHVMEHAERLCDQLVVIARGQKRFGGTVAQALALAPRRAAVTTAGAFDLGAALAQRGFATTEETGQPPEAGRRWHVNLPAGRDAQDALRAAIEAGAPVMAFAPEGIRLRDVFVSLAGDAPETDKAAASSEAA